jgi:hypothetical protein
MDTPEGMLPTRTALSLACCLYTITSFTRLEQKDAVLA